MLIVVVPSQELLLRRLQLQLQRLVLVHVLVLVLQSMLKPMVYTSKHIFTNYINIVTRKCAPSVYPSGLMAPWLLQAIGLRHGAPYILDVKLDTWALTASAGGATSARCKPKHLGLDCL